MSYSTSKSSFQGSNLFKEALSTSIQFYFQYILSVLLLFLSYIIVEYFIPFYLFICIILSDVICLTAALKCFNPLVQSC